MKEVDRRITDPHYDEQFLTWYEGVFESVYIALHPFCKIAGIDPASAPRAVLVVDRSTLPDKPLTMDVVKALSAQNKEHLSLDLPALQRMEKEVGVPVSWAEVRTACGFDSIAQVNTALLITIMAIKKELGSADDAEHLQAYCAANKIFLPTEDTVPPILEAQICSFLKRIGYENVVIADEFNDTVVARKVADLDTETPWVLSDSIGFRLNKIYPEDHSFLMVAPWDSLYMAICGSRRALDTAGIEELFDGFWCDATTRPDWWCQ